MGTRFAFGMLSVSARGLWSVAAVVGFILGIGAVDASANEQKCEGRFIGAPTRVNTLRSRPDLEFIGGEAWLEYTSNSAKQYKQLRFGDDESPIRLGYGCEHYCSWASIGKNNNFKYSIEFSLNGYRIGQNSEDGIPSIPEWISEKDFLRWRTAKKNPFTELALWKKFKELPIHIGVKKDWMDDFMQEGMRISYPSDVGEFIMLYPRRFIRIGKEEVIQNVHFISKFQSFTYETMKGERRTAVTAQTHAGCARIGLVGWTDSKNEEAFAAAFRRFFETLRLEDVVPDERQSAFMRKLLRPVDGDNKEQQAPLTINTENQK